MFSSISVLKLSPLLGASLRTPDRIARRAGNGVTRMISPRGNSPLPLFRWQTGECRFMASADSPSGPVHQRLTGLRNGLLSLHKTLLDSERASYERDVARIASTNELLRLVLYDPWFAWLHELSELVVLIDETLDAKEAPNGIDAERLIAQARELVAPNENGAGFRKRYF